MFCNRAAFSGERCFSHSSETIEQKGMIRPIMDCSVDSIQNYPTSCRSPAGWTPPPAPPAPPCPIPSSHSAMQQLCKMKRIQPVSAASPPQNVATCGRIANIIISPHQPAVKRLCLHQETHNNTTTQQHPEPDSSGSLEAFCLSMNEQS